jgi:hypothetical protein
MTRIAIDGTTLESTEQLGLMVFFNRLKVFLFCPKSVLQMAQCSTSIGGF